MEQHLAEKEDYKCKDRNSEKNVEGEFSSVIAIEQSFHGTAILKLLRCFVSVCLRINPSVRTLLSTREISLSWESLFFTLPITEATHISC